MKYLLPVNAKPYKANLHCHSTFSDGRNDVETLKKIYKAHGYSVVAFSDHNVLIPHPELQDDGFIPLTATEIDVNGGHDQTYHLNFFSRDQYKTEFPQIERIYGTDGINKIIEAGNKNGFLCQYNHPRWSFQSASDFVGLKGLWGFEVFNTGCEVEMNDGWGDYEYEVMCRESGYLPVAIATDDNHNGMTDTVGGPYDDSFGGWTTVFSEELTYDGIYNAMKKGDLYATTGPEILKLFTDNGKVFVECTPVCSVCIRFETRRSDRIRSEHEDITHAEFDITGSFDHFRIELKDIRGNKALTRAYGKDMI